MALREWQGDAPVEIPGSQRGGCRGDCRRLTGIPRWRMVKR